jgi:preprotein translocase subunit SecD
VKRARGLIASLVFVGVLVAGSLALLFTGTEPQLGLDLVGGVSVVLSAPEGTDRDVMERALESIRDRVDALGVAEPSLQLLGDRNIEVQIPGLAQGDIVRDGGRFCVTSSAGQPLGCFETRADAEAALQETGQSRLLDLIGRTARLEFREVLGTVPPGTPEYGTTRTTCGPTFAEAHPDECTNDALAVQEVTFFGKPGDPVDEQLKYELSPARLIGGIKNAAASLDPGDGSVCGQANAGQWCIDFTLTGDAAKTFGDLTTSLSGRQLAIVLDRRVQSAPTVNTPITDGRGQITGSFTEQEAKDLAVVLKSGALPVELTKESVETVSATLGEESLHQGLLAGLIGLVALALYLAFYYRILGVITWFGMAVWAILAITLTALLGRYAGYSLTLAGVAGLVVSIGITADSYIVFYERLKDEVRKGKTVRTAVQPAFKRAWHTIVAADIVTIMAAAVLYVLAISSVRGFALTLGLATALDMFVVYFFKRPLVFLLARNDRLTNLPGFGLRSGVAADPLPGEDLVPAGAGARTGAAR